MAKSARKEAESEPAPPPPPALVFNDAFAVKKPGDVILQAGDQAAECFYFRLSLLAELSSFFADLPPPCPADLVDGTPLIPLHNTTSNGLHIFLAGIRSTTSSEPYESPDWSGTQSILDAAIMGKMYACPIIFRLLVESTTPRGPGEGSEPFLDFAIWAIGDVRPKLQQAATATLRFADAGHITEVDESIANACKAHCMNHWAQLQDFHLRHAYAPARFHHSIQRHHAAVNPLPAALPPHGLLDQITKCTEASNGIPKVIHRKLLGLQTIREIQDFWAKNLGMTCPVCIKEVRGRYENDIRSLNEFALSFLFAG